MNKDVLNSAEKSEQCLDILNIQSISQFFHDPNISALRSLMCYCLMLKSRMQLLPLVNLCSWGVLVLAVLCSLASVKHDGQLCPLVRPSARAIARNEGENSFRFCGLCAWVGTRIITCPSEHVGMRWAERSPGCGGAQLSWTVNTHMCHTQCASPCWTLTILLFVSPS